MGGNKYQIVISYANFSVPREVSELVVDSLTAEEGLILKIMRIWSWISGLKP